MVAARDGSLGWGLAIDFITPAYFLTGVGPLKLRHRKFEEMVRWAAFPEFFACVSYRGTYCIIM
jgi:hypothetical protein